MMSPMKINYSAMEKVDEVEEEDESPRGKNSQKELTDFKLEVEKDRAMNRDNNNKITVEEIWICSFKLIV